jgi:hypothetical protein
MTRWRRSLGTSLEADRLHRSYEDGYLMEDLF